MYILHTLQYLFLPTVQMIGPGLYLNVKSFIGEYIPYEDVEIVTYSCRIRMNRNDTVELISSYISSFLTFLWM